MAGALYIGKFGDKTRQSCGSVFRLVGRNEDALTYALGYLLSKDPAFCVAFLEQCGVVEARLHRRWAKLFMSTVYEVHLQEIVDGRFGRRDIVVELEPHLRVVFEAKIGKGRPTARQLLKYAADTGAWNRFKPKSACRAIVAITRNKQDTQVNQLVAQKLRRKSIRFYGVQWCEVYSLAWRSFLNGKGLAPHWVLDEFVRFFRRDYEMEHYDAEVAIQDVDNLNAEIFFEGGMYVTDRKDKAEPLYFAPYLTNTIRKESSYKSPYNGISQVSRVLYVEDLTVEEFLGTTPDSIRRSEDHRRERWTIGLNLIRSRAMNEAWDRSNVNRLYFLDRPFRLPGVPLVKSKKPAIIPQRIPSGFSLTFEQLLRRRSKDR